MKLVQMTNHHGASDLNPHFVKGGGSPYLVKGAETFHKIFQRMHPMIAEVPEIYSYPGVLDTFPGFWIRFQLETTSYSYWLKEFDFHYICQDVNDKSLASVTDWEHCSDGNIIAWCGTGSNVELFFEFEKAKDEFTLGGLIIYFKPRLPGGIVDLEGIVHPPIWPGALDHRNPLATEASPEMLEMFATPIMDRMVTLGNRLYDRLKESHADDENSGRPRLRLRNNVNRPRFIYEGTKDSIDRPPFATYTTPPLGLGVQSSEELVKRLTTVVETDSFAGLPGVDRVLGPGMLLCSQEQADELNGLYAFIHHRFPASIQIFPQIVVADIGIAMQPGEWHTFVRFEIAEGLHFNFVTLTETYQQTCHGMANGNDRDFYSFYELNEAELDRVEAHLRKEKSTQE